jgi:glycosyltransferase involved in cell wall biosynthesis
MAMATAAVALAEELDLTDRVVFFNDGWVPHAERGRFLLDADVAVSAHFDDIETRFAFRTRLLDCLWAGLPVVTTQGDTLGDLIVEAGGGLGVSFRDVDGWVDALDRLLQDDGELERAGAAAADLRSSFELPRTLEPLRRLADPATTLATPSTRRAAGLEYLALRLRIGYGHHGAGGAARILAERAGAALRRAR